MSKRPAPTPALRTIQEAIIILGISESSIYKLISTDVLDVRRVGKRTMITQASIDSIITNGAA